MSASISASTSDSTTPIIPTVVGGPVSPADEGVVAAPAPAGAVLGATREAGDGAAVLGARRGRTGDNTNTVGRAAAIGAAAIGAVAVASRKKEEEK